MSPSSMRKKSCDVKSAGRPLWVMVPSHTLLEASRHCRTTAGNSRGWVAYFWLERRLVQRSLATDRGSERFTRLRPLAFEPGAARVDGHELPVFGTEVGECCFGQFVGQYADVDDAIVPRVA